MILLRIFLKDTVGWSSKEAPSCFPTFGSFRVRMAGGLAVHCNDFPCFWARSYIWLPSLFPVTGGHMSEIQILEYEQNWLVPLPVLAHRNDPSWRGMGGSYIYLCHICWMGLIPRGQGIPGNKVSLGINTLEVDKGVPWESPLLEGDRATKISCRKAICQPRTPPVYLMWLTPF